MKKIVLTAVAFIFLAPAHAQNFSPEELARRTIERRAIEAVNWGMPAVNYDLMLQDPTYGAAWCGCAFPQNGVHSMACRGTLCAGPLSHLVERGRNWRRVI
jgi:hypothetical protein